MVQYSDAILNLVGGPDLSELTFSDAKELPPFPNYLEHAKRHHIFGTRFRDASLTHLSINIVKNTNAAASSYRSGRQHLFNYLADLNLRKHNLPEYSSSVQQFEYSIDRAWRALECCNKFEHKGLSKPFKKMTLYKQGDRTSSGALSIFERINELNNVSKHFNADQAAQSSAPVWLTNTGIRSAEYTIKFDELFEVITDLVKINHENFFAIPAEAAARNLSK